MSPMMRDSQAAVVPLFGTGLNDARPVSRNPRPHWSLSWIYIATLVSATHVLHAFQKKTQKTAKWDLVGKRTFGWAMRRPVRSAYL
jgi:phage-related protein